MFLIFNIKNIKIHFINIFFFRILIFYEQKERVSTLIFKTSTKQKKYQFSCLKSAPSYKEIETTYKNLNIGCYNFSEKYFL